MPSVSSFKFDVVRCAVQNTNVRYGCSIVMLKHCDDCDLLFMVIENADQVLNLFCML